MFSFLHQSLLDSEIVLVTSGQVVVGFWSLLSFRRRLFCGGVWLVGDGGRRGQSGEPGRHGRLGAGQSSFQRLADGFPRLHHAAAGRHHGVPDLLPALAVLHRV